jgi:cell division protein FtsB
MTVGTLEIVGMVLTVVMSVNGFFLKGVYSDMQFLKIELAKLIARHDNTAEDTEENKQEIYKMRESIQAIRQRLHTLEGRDAQLMQFIEDFAKEKHGS